MKPGDHPDFFRFAPPPGASRESTIVLDRQGHFFHDGQRVDHPGLEKALRSWISIHPDDARPILTNGYDWCYFRPEATPMFVEAVAVQGDGTATLKLFDGTEEPLTPESLSIDDDGVVHARVREGRMEARFLRHAQIGLAPLLESADPPTLRVAGKTHVLPRREAP
ncbi:MAG: hypothetical protein R3B70_07530 [Polyangiaceae bacterium]